MSWYGGWRPYVPVAQRRAQEILGGRHDGETSWSGFNFDVSALLESLDAGHIGIGTGMGEAPPELLVDGEFRGKHVLLHLCLEPPEDAEATEIIDLTTPGKASVREKE